jgi:hypothetical protein
MIVKEKTVNHETCKCRDIEEEAETMKMSVLKQKSGTIYTT